MTDRDRLIELLVKYKPYDEPIKQMAERMVIEKIADYLLANGVIVPKFNVGDTVDIFYKTKEEAEEKLRECNNGK